MMQKQFGSKEIELRVHFRFITPTHSLNKTKEAYSSFEKARNLLLSSF
jgi:hypothetical protein